MSEDIASEFAYAMKTNSARSFSGRELTKVQQKVLNHGASKTPTLLLVAS